MPRRPLSGITRIETVCPTASEVPGHVNLGKRAQLLEADFATEVYVYYMEVIKISLVFLNVPPREKASS